MVEVVVDNRFVVPYNPWLTTKYDAHINVEFCSFIKAVKYLYKYIFKGHDRATVSFKQNECENENSGIRETNEPAEYLDARYVGTMEASWRLNHFEMHGRSPAVKVLAIHLKDQHTVNFEEGEVDHAAQEAEIPHSPHTSRRYKKTPKPLIFYIATSQNITHGLTKNENGKVDTETRNRSDAYTLSIEVKVKCTIYALFCTTSQVQLLLKQFGRWMVMDAILTKSMRKKKSPRR